MIKLDLQMFALKRASEIPTIDVNLVTITTKTSEGVVEKEIALDTASKIGVSPEVETQDAIKLIIKGVLKAQKRKKTIVTGNTIVLTDNVFTPELVQILQGGSIVYDDTDTSKVLSYTPPDAGSDDTGEEFQLVAYSAIYNAAGIITGYEKITYPNCQGDPIALTSEDNVFRVNEYSIFSAPEIGEPPFKIEYIAPDALPIPS